MTYALGTQSRERLGGVHPNLVKIVKRAIELTTVDFMVLEGVRTEARQKELYAQGRTTPGKIVTWTMNSKHRIQPDGFGHAVDLVPYPIDWEDPIKFDTIALAMKSAACELGLENRLRWGADWDQDGNPREKGELDSPHFEI